MTDRDDRQMDQTLDTLFGEMRDRPVIVPDALITRILSDADNVLDARASDEAARRATRRPHPRHPWISAAVAALGGWRAVAGLATAAVTGLAIGLGAPGAVTSLATGYPEVGYEDTVSGYGLDDLVPSFYALAAEG